MVIWQCFCPAPRRAFALAGINLFFYIFLSRRNARFDIPSLFLLFTFVGYYVAKGSSFARFWYPPLGIVSFVFLLPNLGIPVTTSYFANPEDMVVILGLSYVCFRMLLYGADFPELGTISLAGYFAYILYFPTCFVGPLTSPRAFLASINSAHRGLTVTTSNLQRFLLGFVKMGFLSGMAERLGFDSIVLDGNTHGIIAIVVASVAFYVRLWLNFSGACDMVISLSRMFSIHIDENFDHHWLASNISEYWNRWHITLSSLLKRLVFTPLSYGLLRRTQGRYQRFIVSFSLFVTFSLVAIWHGYAVNWILFGFLHGLAMVVWTMWGYGKQRWEGNARFQRILASRAYFACCWILVHGYVAFTLIFFVNDLDRIREILTYAIN